MSGIKDIFAKTGHKALIIYLTVGYPNVETTLEIVPLIASSGCDLVELGIPFRPLSRWYHDPEGELPCAKTRDHPRALPRGSSKAESTGRHTARVHDLFQPGA